MLNKIPYLLKNPKFVLVLTLVAVIPFVVYVSVKSSHEQVLGREIGAIAPISSPLHSPTLRPSPTPIEASASLKVSKAIFNIAIFGDSMVDTMGENLEYLQKSLKAKYPQTSFNLYNYGIGGQNVAQGQERFGRAFSYQGRTYSPITQIKADVIIVGSFAYNPFASHDKQRHLEVLANLVGEAKATGAQVYLLAEIAPLEVGFGVGPSGINWPAELADMQAQHVVEQLANVFFLSKSLNVPLINAYGLSKDTDSKFGMKVYVNGSDGIHPSVQGHVLMSNLIATSLKLK